MISHNYKCLFIHIPKTAGISIEKKFCELLNLDYEDRAPLILGRNNRPNLGPPRLAHLKLMQYVDCHYMSKELFIQYYKFAFVRHPVDRIFSAYKFRGYAYFCSFEKFTERALKRLKNENWFFANQTSFLTDDNGYINIDFIGKFENLNSDFEKICEALNIEDSNLPHYNRTKTSVSFLKKLFRIFKLIKADPKAVNLFSFTNKKNSKITKKSRELVYELYREDYDNFNYEL